MEKHKSTLRASGRLHSSAEDIFGLETKEQYLSYFWLNRGHNGGGHCLVFLQRAAPVERREGWRDGGGEQKEKTNHVNRGGYTIFIIYLLKCSKLERHQEQQKGEEREETGEKVVECYQKKKCSTRSRKLPHWQTWKSLYKKWPKAHLLQPVQILFVYVCGRDVLQPLVRVWGGKTPLKTPWRWFLLGRSTRCGSVVPLGKVQFGKWKIRGQKSAHKNVSNCQRDNAEPPESVRYPGGKPH